MAKLEIRFAMVVVLAVAASLAIVSGNSAWVLAQQQSCHGDMQSLSTQCMRYIRKGSPRARPSQACCDLVKNTDVTCVCEHLSHEMEQQLNMENVVYVAGYCGKPLIHGIQCGGYTVP